MAKTRPAGLPGATSPMMVEVAVISSQTTSDPRYRHQVLRHGFSFGRPTIEGGPVFVVGVVEGVANIWARHRAEDHDLAGDVGLVIRSHNTSSAVTPRGPVSPQLAP